MSSSSQPLPNMSSLADMLSDDAAFSISKAQAHLTLLRMLCAVYDAFGVKHTLQGEVVPGFYTPQQAEAMTNHYLSVADYRYRLYLELLVSVRTAPKESWPLPPWDVLLIMHAHLLSPLKFANDISSNPRYGALAGMVDLPLMKLQHALRNLDDVQYERPDGRWSTKYSEMPGEVIRFLSRDGSFPPRLAASFRYNPKKFRFRTPSPLSLDLVEAVKRQVAFARKITSLYPHDPVPDSLLLDYQQRYVKFMNLIRLNTVRNNVPALEIDLFWHTHQLHSSNYLQWCKHHIGRSVNHDDTIDEGNLAIGLGETVQAWEGLYSEDYINPAPGSGPTFKNVSPHSFSAEPSTADKTPPYSLSPAQLRLWNFDVEHQDRHEKMNSKYRQLQDQIKIWPTSSAPNNGATGLIKRLLKTAVIDTGPRSAAANRNRSSQQMSYTLQVHTDTREAWGRERWPLLVAARGFGDPSVTAGEYERPPQGTTKLDFPIYPATWYDDKQLGYYDYITGGKGCDGVIHGGGLSVGGGMCGGRFNGGNCIAVAPIRSNNAGCTGGGGCAG